MSYKEQNANLPAALSALWFFIPETGQEPHRVLPDGAIDIIFPEGGAPFVVGAMTAAALAQADRPCTGLRFRPGGAQTLLKMDWAEATDRHLNAADLGLKLPDAPTLIKHLQNRQPDPLILHTADRLKRGEPIEQIAQAIGYSRRTLERRFKTATGLGLKTYSRIMRFRRTIKTDFSARSALEAGYYDQAHLYREVKRFAAIIQDNPPQNL
ncbi:MAG: DUF6597 domain-containing transcriptional factor [Campylobacterales bacterium]